MISDDRLYVSFIIHKECTLYDYIAFVTCSLYQRIGVVGWQYISFWDQYSQKFQMKKLERNYLKKKYWNRLVHHVLYFGYLQHYKYYTKQRNHFKKNKVRFECNKKSNDWLNIMDVTITILQHIVLKVHCFVYHCVCCSTCLMLTTFNWAFW